MFLGLYFGKVTFGEYYVMKDERKGSNIYYLLKKLSSAKFEKLNSEFSVRFDFFLN